MQGAFGLCWGERGDQMASLVVYSSFAFDLGPFLCLHKSQIAPPRPFNYKPLTLRCSVLHYVQRKDSLHGAVHW